MRFDDLALRVVVVYLFQQEGLLLRGVVDARVVARLILLRPFPTRIAE